jgi:hypothetical protein
MAKGGMSAGMLLPSEFAEACEAPMWPDWLFLRLGIVSDEPRGIEYHEQRTQIV